MLHLRASRRSSWSDKPQPSHRQFILSVHVLTRTLCGRSARADAHTMRQPLDECIPQRCMAESKSSFQMRAERMQDSDLAEVNACLAHFQVTMYRGSDRRYRIWGGINRIQDIVDSPCVERFPGGALADLNWFFMHEVDAQVAANLERFGVHVDYDPNNSIGLSFHGDGPTDEQMAEATRAAYDWYRLPPDHRHANPSD